MATLEYVHESPAPRMLLLSQRRLAPVVSHCRLYEFEDLVARIDAVDIAAPTRRPIRNPQLRRLGRALERWSVGTVVAPRAWRTGRAYEALLLSCQTLAELNAMVPLGPLRRSARVVACYVEELWRSDIAPRASEVALLRQFDHVFVGNVDAALELRSSLGGRVTYLPSSVDTLAIGSHPADQPRPIDIYSMGRRSAALHARLMDLAAANGLFYLYDTRQDSGVTSIQEHRRSLSGMIARSRFFIVTPATPKGRSGADYEAHEEDVGARYFEGAAGGAVLLGQAPRTAAYDQLMGWRDAVVPVRSDGSDLDDVFRRLDADPERLEAISRRNVRECLRRHDGVYRWRTVLESLGLSISDGVRSREETCRRLSGELEPTRA